ncbi:MAG TPA: RNA-binding protein [Parvularcula sp.]|nr:RNA-binding protein [Parvularcula sp.]HBS31165.1 RNA-binding protein [Parvularcula sp.]
MTPDIASGEAVSRRLDKWLWCARVFRTRQAAASFIEDRTVRLTRNGRTERIGKPGFGLKAGDEISLILADRPVAYRVRAFARRRGSGPQAAALFEVLTAT